MKTILFHIVPANPSRNRPHVTVNLLEPSDGDMSGHMVHATNGEFNKAEIIKCPREAVALWLDWITKYEAT